MATARTNKSAELRKKTEVVILLTISLLKFITNSFRKSSNFGPILLHRQRVVGREENVLAELLLPSKLSSLPHLTPPHLTPPHARRGGAALGLLTMRMDASDVNLTELPRAVGVLLPRAPGRGQRAECSQ